MCRISQSLTSGYAYSASKVSTNAYPLDCPPPDNDTGASCSNNSDYDDNSYQAPKRHRAYPHDLSQDSTLGFDPNNTVHPHSSD
ncbi:hypothetical protein NDU88_011741 [Pleurodeles waltl]|uniref:Uncharacterized protein n=1 Tax=Pleurodeles waltl TaxID=8319 RepID=A0AAV7QZM7_PLEWA|nr:hypothetical protein NDU88_011741 [Pleurodeles waltl]